MMARGCSQHRSQLYYTLARNFRARKQSSADASHSYTNSSTHLAHCVIWTFYCWANFNRKFHTKIVIVIIIIVIAIVMMMLASTCLLWNIVLCAKEFMDEPRLRWANMFSSIISYIYTGVCRTRCVCLQKVSVTTQNVYASLRTQTYQAPASNKTHNRSLCAAVVVILTKTTNIVVRRQPFPCTHTRTQTLLRNNPTI